MEAAGQKVWRFCALVFRAGGVAWATAKGQSDMRPVLGGDEMSKCPIRKPFFFSTWVSVNLSVHPRYLTGIFPSPHSA